VSERCLLIAGAPEDREFFERADIARYPMGSAKKRKIRRNGSRGSASMPDARRQRRRSGWKKTSCIGDSPTVMPAAR